MITVYTKPECSQCESTKRVLDKHHIEYRTVDVTEDAEGRAHVEALGYLGVPVVYVNEKTHWSGFRYERLKGLRNG